MTTVRLGVEERRRRLAIRHGLHPDARLTSATDAARAVVALHATDPASVHLSAWARMTAADVPAIERELYDDRSIVRMLGMRRTVFVVPRELVPVVQAAVSRSIAATERRKFARRLEEHGVAEDGPAWFGEVLDATAGVLAGLGEALSTEISAAEPRLREGMVVNVGKRYEGRLNVSVPALFVLAAEGRIVRGRPRGSWVSSQYRWSTTEAWLGGPIPDLPVPEARAELVRHWLRAYGPGTLDDVRWWSGLAVREVRAAVAAAGTVEVDMDGVPGLALADDQEATPDPGPWLAFLPALDPTTMGWQDRDWYLGDHRPLIFDTYGNAGPTVWLDGRIVGGWVQRPDGEIAFRLLEDVGRDARALVEAEAERLRTWIGDVRFGQRWPSPLVRELLR